MRQTLQECKQINEVVRNKIYKGDAEQRFFNDFSDSAKSSEQANKFQLCFNEPEGSNYQVTSPNRLWKKHPEPQPIPVKNYQVEEVYDEMRDSGWVFPCVII